MDNKDRDLVTFGLGVGAGVCSIWLLIELWPLVLLGGAGYLVLKGMENSRIKENTK
jgi:hypothetical protein